MLFTSYIFFVLVPEKLKGQIKQKNKADEDGPVGILCSVLISIDDDDDDYCYHTLLRSHSFRELI